MPHYSFEKDSPISTSKVYKCTRCHCFYTNESSHACVYHPAPWIDLHVPGKGTERIGVWTCCKEPLKKAPGCTKGVHVEDTATTNHLQQFEIIAVKGTREEAIDVLNKEYFKDSVLNTKFFDTKQPMGYLNEQTPDENGFIKHEVLKTDTIAGIALKYDTTTTKLKQINRLFTNDEIYKLKHILVPAVPNPNLPPSPHFSNTWYIEKLVRTTGACPEEARFYLEDNHWDVVLARESREKDITWAEEELRSRKGKLKEWLGDRDLQTVAVVGLGAVLVILCIIL